MTELVKQFKKYLKPNFYKVLSKAEMVTPIVLHEENDDGREKTKPYDIYLDITTFKDDSCILIDSLEKIKHPSVSNFLKAQPCDCDFVLINETRKKIFFMELKDTNYDINQILKQLTSGEKWLEHLFFCSDFNDWNLNGYDLFYIFFKYSKKTRPPSKSRGYKEVSGNKVYCFIGNEFNINRVRMPKIN